MEFKALTIRIKIIQSPHPFLKHQLIPGERVLQIILRLLNINTIMTSLGVNKKSSNASFIVTKEKKNVLK